LQSVSNSINHLNFNVMNTMQRSYPVGIQTFERIINERRVYIDKTDLVWKLAHVAPFIFLSRPRRFGKSLLTTTLESYFEGKKNLFEGLKIMELEKEWKSYPVIHLDLSMAKNCDDVEMLRDSLKFVLRPYLELYNYNNDGQQPGKLFAEIIRKASNNINGNVVVLIDEYDSPLLDVLYDREGLLTYKKVMQEFYQPLKACEKMIKFCFITGITKFSQLSIFSTLNNIMNLSMHPDFAAICGITEHELTYDMAEDIAMLAKQEECSPEEMHQKLKMMYDGYHFSENSEDIYNPYSLMNCFAQKRVKDFWFESGTTSFLFKQIQHFGTDITSLNNIEASESDFYLPTEVLDNALPLLYQSGYLTIKGYFKESESYILGIPNNEVMVGLTRGLLPMYSGIRSDSVKLGCAFKIFKALNSGNIDQALSELQAFLAGVPYVDGFKKKLSEAATREGFWEYTMYLILSMMNIYVQTQVRCHGGRIDMAVFSATTTYIFEFKLNGSAKSALEQIDEKHYSDPFTTSPNPVVKIGVSFDLDQWNIRDWMIG